MSFLSGNANNKSFQSGGAKWILRFIPRERVIAGLVVLAFVGSVVFFGLRWIERNVAFHPLHYSANEVLVLPPGAEDTWFQTADGVRLNGWFFRTSQPSLATVIYFHGNGGNIRNIGWVGERLRDRGFNVLLVDYRGYGRSEGDIVDEDGIYADADAAYDYVVRKIGVPPDKIVLYGQSLGTSAAVDVASRKPCGAMILESGLSSASSMASNVLPWLPRWLHFLGRNRFESTRKLASVRCPVLITHGDPDRVIPTEEARKLFAAAHEPKRLVLFPGAGHNVFGSQGEVYLNLITNFVKEAQMRPDTVSNMPTLRKLTASPRRDITDVPLCSELRIPWQTDKAGET